MLWEFQEIHVEGEKTMWRKVNTCELCGTVFTSPRPQNARYCPVCRTAVRAEQNRNRVRRWRAKNLLPRGTDDWSTMAVPTDTGQGDEQ